MNDWTRCAVEADLAQVTVRNPVLGTLRAPWRWERLLHDAAVLGGRERWKRRLDGLEDTRQVVPAHHRS